MRNSVFRKRNLTIGKQIQNLPCDPKSTLFISYNMEFTFVSASGFDSTKLKASIENTWRKNGKQSFPTFAISMDDYDITPYKSATFDELYPDIPKDQLVKELTRDDGTEVLGGAVGFIRHDTADAFYHTCDAIAAKFHVRRDLVECAAWMLHVYAYDEDVLSSCPEQLKDTFGLRDDDALLECVQVYACYDNNIAELAVHLE